MTLHSSALGPRVAACQQDLGWVRFLYQLGDFKIKLQYIGLLQVCDTAYLDLHNKIFISPYMFWLEFPFKVATFQRKQDELNVLLKGFGYVHSDELIKLILKETYLSKGLQKLCEIFLLNCDFVSKDMFQNLYIQL
jgi:hypothetical protein